MSRFLTTNRNIELLEPYEGKLSRTVLRGERGSNALDLPDNLGHGKADITFAYLYKYGAPDLEKDPLEAAEFFRCAALFSKDGFKELAFVDEDALWEAFNLFLYGGESRKPLCVRSALSVLSDLREKRSPYALYLTGEIYHKGLYGETVDLDVAYKFYQEAAELGCKEAEEVLNEIAS